MAVDGISKAKLGHLWARVWDEDEECLKSGIAIEVFKVKSHEKNIDKVPKILQDGNNCADHHAGLGVRECPSGEANRIHNIDSKARWFQEGMVQAILLLPKKGRRPNERDHVTETESHIRILHITQRKARAHLLKHDVIRRGPMLECKRCGQFWESTASSMIFSEGICPGPKIYGTPQKRKALDHPCKKGSHLVG